MASVIANQFGEADGLKLSSLVAIGLLLFHYHRRNQPDRAAHSS